MAVAPTDPGTPVPSEPTTLLPPAVPAFEPSDDPLAPPVPDHDTDGGPADRPPWRSRLRRTPIAVAALVLLLVGASVVAGHEPPPGLADQAPVGWGDADGRDAARTGRMGTTALPRPGAVATTVDVANLGSQLGRLERFDDLLVWSHGGTIEGLDRDTGDVQWQVPGTDVERRGVLLAHQDRDGRSTLLDPRNGEVVEGPPGVVLTTLPGPAFVVLETGATGAVRLHRGDEVVWEVATTLTAVEVVDASDDWLLLAGRRLVGGDGGGIRPHLAVDLATGQATRLDLDLGDEVHLLDGDRGVLLERGRASSVNLRTGGVGERLRQLDGGVQVGGSIVMVNRGLVQRAFDRATLRQLWEHSGVGSLPSFVEADQQAGLVPVFTGSGIAWLTPREGRLVTRQQRPDVLAYVDRRGRTEIRTTGLTRVDLTGRTQWRHALRAGEVQAGLRSLDDGTLVVAQQFAWGRIAPDADGGLVQGGFNGQDANRIAGPVRVLGDEVVRVAQQGLLSTERRSAQRRWEADLPGQVHDVVATPASILAATEDGLVVVDPRDGRLLVERRGEAWVGLTAAGPTDVFALARAGGAVGSEGACLTAPGGCDTTVVRLDAATLEPSWRSEVLPGACGAVTVGDRTVAVPQVEGVAFLDVRTGEVVARWPGPPAGCRGVAFDGDDFVVVADEGLLVGPPDGPPRLVPTSTPAVTAPVLFGGQVVVGLEGGELVALDLERDDVAWSVRLPAPALAPPVLAGDRLALLVEGGTVVLFAGGATAA